MVVFEDISILIVFVWISVGFMRSSSISFADTYEFSVLESMSVRYLMLLIFSTMIGNKFFLIWFVVKAIFFVGVGWLIGFWAGIS